MITCFEIELALQARLILRSRVWIQTKLLKIALHSVQLLLFTAFPRAVLIFPRLQPILRFPVLSANRILPCVTSQLHVFPCFFPVMCTILGLVAALCCLENDWKICTVISQSYSDPFVHSFFQDKAMSYFFEHGRFQEDRREYPRKSKNLFIVLCWNTILCLPLVWYFISVILSGSIASLLTAAAIVLVGTLHNQFWINHILALHLKVMEINSKRFFCSRIVVNKQTT